MDVIILNKWTTAVNKLQITYEQWKAIKGLLVNSPLIAFHCVQ